MCIIVWAEAVSVHAGRQRTVPGQADLREPGDRDDHREDEHRELGAAPGARRDRDAGFVGRYGAHGRLPGGGQPGSDWGRRTHWDASSRSCSTLSCACCRSGAAMPERTSCLEWEVRVFVRTLGSDGSITLLAQPSPCCPRPFQMATTPLPSSATVVR